MIHSNFSFIATEIPDDHPPTPKTMLWTSAHYGCDDEITFPDITSIKARFSTSSLHPLTAFVKAIADARERVWLLDDYLLKPKTGTDAERIDQILSWLPENLEANDIRFFTKSANRDEDEIRRRKFSNHAELINRRRRTGNCRIEIKFTLQQNFPYIHDRFAIIDNELWHFGAAIGGMHNQVNISSRGWDARAHGAIEFFELAWNHEEKAEKKKMGNTKCK